MSDSIQQKQSTIPKVYSIIILILAPIAVIYLGESLCWTPWSDMTISVQLVNILLGELFFFLFFLIIGRARIALLLSSFLLFAAYLANYYVMSFRGQAIMPWDIYSINTAAAVAGNYDFSLESKQLIIIALFILLLILELFVRLTLKKWKWYLRAALLLVPIAGFAGCFQAMKNEDICSDLGMYPYLFTPNVMYRDNGAILNFIYLLQFMDISEPDGYSSEKAEELLEEYSVEKEVTSTPNIIVIMNECFSDPAILADFKTNVDYMPFVHSLQQGSENTITGYVDVSVKGGNTANSEFEFLTGNTMAFLPSGSIPYQQYIFEEKDSIASWLKGLGYVTYAMHPYNANGWNRAAVYPLLGFDSFISNSNFQSPKRIRSYISDESAFKRIIQLYENKEEGTPLFTFTVTMQNHGGFTKEYANFTPDVEIEGCSSKAITQYLSLIKISDAAFEDLCNYFADAEEDTIIVMFGDHQPNDSVVEPLLNLNDRSQNDFTEEEWLERYRVPLVIWANFDIAESTDVGTSLNYLAGDLLEICGLPLTNYQSYLQTLQENYPVISSQGAIDSKGTYYPLNKIDSLSDINTYEQLQYYQLFE
ncbi:MAG: LTA synthase family protein [Lachnospiraceae bacterium]